MPGSKAVGQSLLISLILIGATLLIIEAYMAYTQRQSLNEEAVSVFLIKRKKAISHPPLQEIKITKPIVPPLISIEKVQIAPRAVTAAVVKAPRVSTTTVTVLEFNAFPIKHHVQTDATVPEVRVVPEVVTYARIPTTAPPKGMVLPASLESPTIGRGMVERHVKVARGPMRPKGLSIIKNITVADAGLADVAQAVTMGRTIVPPLPKGEPGGRVIGRGKDIQGVFRLARLHHDLADWWADPSSLVALTGWLNTQTEIKTDMNVEGGAIRLTDPRLSKAPLVFFTGHDPAIVRSRELARGAPIRGRLPESERGALRRYLIEDGGFIFFDDCGVNAPAQAFLKLVLAQLRYAVPEYSADRIPNDHEIYNNYYSMRGPPVGHDIFWWGTHPPKRNFLEGITIGDHLGVLMCRRDYMCSMRTVSAPSWPAHYSPSVLRFCTNVVVYALTHGGISDYSDYVPEDRTADRISIESPIAVPADP